MANQIERPSLQTSLEERYAGSDKAAYPKEGNFIDVTNEFSKNFTRGTVKGETQFTDKALNYSDSMGLRKSATPPAMGVSKYSDAMLNKADSLGLSSKKYKG